MSTLDVEQLLQPISDDKPCGDDLEYDPGFIEMNAAAEGKPAQQMGDEVIEGQDPDWGAVRGKAIDLLGRTKDLRIGVLLTEALVRTEGMPGLDSGLTLVNGLVERHWQAVHPQLDPDDWNDPTMRMNILATIVGDGFLRAVREAVLVESRALGRFSLKDIEMATGELPAPEGVEPPTTATIDGAFLDCELEALQATADSVSASIGHVKTLDSVLTDQVGVGVAPDVSALPKLLESVREVLAEQLARRGVGEAPAAEAPAGAAAPAPIAGEVNSREDVIRVLDKACDYFARHEPSSPVPFLLQRAKRLVSKDFMDIMKDIAPDGVHQAESVTGVKQEE
jgi:type VI secretion system protein ImpA